MSPEQTAMVAATERLFAERFEQLGHSSPQEEAQSFIRDLLRSGWRPWPALVDRAPARRAAPPAVAQAALAGAREVLAAKKGHRPELKEQS